MNLSINSILESLRKNVHESEINIQFQNEEMFQSFTVIFRNNGVLVQTAE